MVTPSAAAPPPKREGPPRTLADALALTDEARVITSVNKPYKIMHTNAAWSRITGFKFTEAAGKTCGILQGPLTEESVLNLLEVSINSGQPITLRLTNYTANGQPFQNTLHVSPLYNSHGDIVNYAASVKSVPILDGSIPAIPPKQHAQSVDSASSWATLRFLAVNKDADGAAADHSEQAREEASQKLIRNHTNVLKDIINESTTLNINGKPLTQLELRRVPAEHELHVDQFLREVSRRLLGRQAGLKDELEEITDPSTPRQATAWISAAKYLEGRIQSLPSQKRGRNPDMSPAAAAVMIAVMQEVAGEAAAWESLRVLLEDSSRSAPLSGAAKEHELYACEEVARKLIHNHVNVLRDITNPANVNIHRKLLTQQYLRRVEKEDRKFVDDFLQELTGRLLGRPPMSVKIMNDLSTADPKIQRKAVAWVSAAKYLEGRIQCKAEQRPGRAPDMSEAAAASLKAVMSELASEQNYVPTSKEAAKPSASMPKRMKRTRNFADLYEAFNNEEDAVIFTEPFAPYKITHVNKAWCDMCGYTAEETEGATNAILQGPETDMSVIADLMKCVRRNEPATGTVVNYKKGGIRFVNQVQIEPVYDENDDLSQFMAILHEIDEMPSIDVA